MIVDILLYIWIAIIIISPFIGAAIAVSESIEGEEVSSGTCGFFLGLAFSVLSPTLLILAIPLLFAMGVAKLFSIIMKRND